MGFLADPPQYLFGGISGSRSTFGQFYASLGNALAEAAPEHFANAGGWQLMGETAVFSTALVLGGHAVGGVGFAAGSTLGFANGLVQTYAADSNAGLWSYALGGGMGWVFGGMNPIGAGTGLTGTLVGGAAFGRRGAQWGGLAGDIAGAGIDDVFRAVGKGANLGSALLHATAQTGVTGSIVAGVGVGTYYATGNADRAFLAASLSTLPANIIGRMVVPCFPAGTPILTPDGSKSIEELKAGDLVVSRSEYDDGTGPVAPKAIEAMFVREGRIIRLHVAGQSLPVTPEHPFYVQRDGWIPAGQLKPGDLLSTSDNQWIPVEKIEETGEWTTVYNFRVAEFHTYFVALHGADFGVWVHNAYAKPILGRPAHGGPTHNGEMISEALNVSGMPGVTGVRTNQALVDTAGNTLSLLRPDVQFIEGGLVHIIEVNVSRGSAYHGDRQQLLSGILGNMFGSYKGI